MNERYIAGFTDADGSISIQAHKSKVDGLFTISPLLQWSQREDRRVILDLLPGKTRKKAEGQYITSITGKEATAYLDRIRRHLVVKRSEADFMLPLCGTRVTEPELKALKKALKATRRGICEHGKVTHSNPWAAGYFDGDGCIYSRLREKGNSYWLETTINVSSWVYQPEGIELLHKAWGGKIRRQDNTVNLWVTVTPHNVQSILHPLSRYAILKKAQIELVRDRYQTLRHNRKGSSKADLISFERDLKSLKRACND